MYSVNHVIVHFWAHVPRLFVTYWNILMSLASSTYDNSTSFNSLSSAMKHQWNLRSCISWEFRMPLERIYSERHEVVMFFVCCLTRGAQGSVKLLGAFLYRSCFLRLPWVIVHLARRFWTGSEIDTLFAVSINQCVDPSENKWKVLVHEKTD